MGGSHEILLHRVFVIVIGTWRTLSSAGGRKLDNPGWTTIDTWQDASQRVEQN